MVDTRKILLDVALQNVTMRSCQANESSERPVRAVALAIRVRVVDEGSLKDRLNYIANGVVDDPVTEWCGGNYPSFGLEDLECPVFSRTVRPSFKLAPESYKVIAQSRVECENIVPETLSSGRLARGAEQIRFLDHRIPQIAESFHRFF